MEAFVRTSSYRNPLSEVRRVPNGTVRFASLGLFAGTLRMKLDYCSHRAKITWSRSTHAPLGRRADYSLDIWLPLCPPRGGREKDRMGNLWHNRPQSIRLAPLL